MSMLFKLPNKSCYTNAAIFTGIHTGVNGIQMATVPQIDKTLLPVPGNLGYGRQHNYSP